MAHLVFAFTLFSTVAAALAQGRAGSRELDGEPNFASLDDAMKAVKSPDAAQQVAGASWMANNKPDAATVVPALVPLLDNAELQHHLSMRAIRISPATTAYRALSSLLPAAIDPLIAAFDHPSANVRTNILHLLNRQKDDRVMKLMIAAIKDASADVRAAAAQGLGAYNTMEAAKPLMAALADKEPVVRAVAAMSLGYAAVQTKPGLPISNFQQGEVVKHLAGALADPDKNTKLAAAEALGRLRSSNAVDALIKAAADRDIQAQVVQSLGEIGSRRAVPAMLPLLKSEDWVVKSLTCQALGKLQDARAVNLLLPLLTERDSSVAMNAAHALGAIGDRRATDALVELLKSRDKHTRGTAARALGRIRDPKAVQPLIALLPTGEEPAREAAIALGELADPAAIDPLVEAIYSQPENQYVIDAACEALEKIRGVRVVRVLAERTLATQKQDYATHRARRTLDKLLDTGFAWSQDALRVWWKEHKGEFEGE